MFGLSRSPLCPIGVDIGASSLKVLQLRHAGGGYALQAAARIELPAARDDAEHLTHVAAALRKALDSGKFLGRRCVSSLTPVQVHARSVRLPQMPDGDLAQAVTWEAKERFAFDLSDGALAWYRAGEVRRGTEVRDEVLLFAAPSDTLRQHVNMLTSVGLKPDAIDLQPSAMVRAMVRAEGRVGVTALIDIGHAGTQLIIAVGGEIVFFKYIEIGAARINAAVAGKLGVGEAEAAQIRASLVRAAGDPSAEAPHLQQAVVDAVRPLLEELGKELDMCIRYYVVTFRGTRPDAIRVVGGQAHCPQVLAALSGTLGVPVEPCAALRGVASLTEITRPDRSVDWAVATGLTLYHLDAAAREAA